MSKFIDDEQSPQLEPNPASELGVIDKAIKAVGTKGQSDFIDEQHRERRRKERNKEAMANPEHTPGVPSSEPFQVITQTETDKGIAPDAPGFGSLVGNEIRNGITANLWGLLRDYGDSQPVDEKLIADLDNKASQLIEKYGWDESMTDELYGGTRSVEEMERKAERIHQQQGFMASLENTSMAKQLAAGFTGFVLDPINLIPGAAIYKGATAAGRIMPAIANTINASAKSRATAWAAMGAVEEAGRNYPRLLNDPTYSYEMYKMDVGLGAAFGGGLSVIPSAGIFVKSKLSREVNEALNQYRTSLNARLAVNKLTDALKVTKNPAAKAAVKKAMDEAAGPETVKAAKKAADLDRAQKQVEESTVNVKLSQMAEKLRTAADEGVVDAEAIVTEFASELRRVHPTFAKIAEAVAERAQRAAKKLEGEEGKSAGAAARQSTLKDKAGDVAADIKTEARMRSAELKETLEGIDNAFALAKGVAKGQKDEIIEQQMAAMQSIAKRAVIEKAKIQGVKPAKVASQVEVNQAVYGKFKRYQKRINQIDLELNRVLKEAGVEDRNIMSPIVGQSFKQVGVRGYVNWRDAIKKDFELGKRLEVVLDERMQRKIDDIYHKAPNADAALYKALDDAYKKVRADIQWSVMAVRDRNAAEVAMDPEWALLSREFRDSMGDDLATLDEIYNSTFNKVLRNQFGGFTRSYAGELAASQSPLAQWLALNIFELPGGTGGKVKRRETAAITMEMYMAEAAHPVNAAWIKAVRAEAQDTGIGGFEAATMKYSSAAADPNANALGRKVQLEMNARQAGGKSNAPKHVKEFADELEKAYDLLYRRQFENKVEGINGQNKIKAYMRQSWSEDRVLTDVLDGPLGRDGFEALVTKALRNRNPNATSGELKQRAETVVDRLTERVNNREGKTQSNIISDGDYINERVLHMDLDTSITHKGVEYNLLDFMSNDVVSDLNKYAKKASAAAAISKASGFKLNSADAIRSFIHAVGQESEALGTHVDVGTLTNAFKLMEGEPIMAFDARARKIRDAVALSGMNGLGESQLAELGLAMNRGMAGLFATSQVASRVAGKYRKAWGGLEMTAKQQDNERLLSEMQSVSTLYEQMHNLARQNVHFDDMYSGTSSSKAVTALNNVVDTVTGGKYRPVLQHIQTKWTGYGSIRTMEEQIAMAGLMHDIGRKLAGKPTSYTSDARLADIGVPMDLLKKKIDDGTITLDGDGNLQSLGLHAWSEAEKHSLGVALRRHAGQQVQMGFAGETSALMSNPWVAFMMQFRSYPNIAAEKQQMRNALFHDKEAAMGFALNAASSMAARVIRYHSLAAALPDNKQESYLNRKYDNLAHDTLMYMGGVGTMVNTFDIAQDPMEVTPPVFGWASNYIKAFTGLGDGMQQQDIANIANAVPLGTILQANLIAGVIRDKMQTAQTPGLLTDAVLGGEEEMQRLIENTSTSSFDPIFTNRGN